MSGYIAAIDQGTTSTRTIIFDDRLHVRGVAQQEFQQHFPQSGWVEHDADDLWRTVVDTLRFALSDAGIAASDLSGIGITNQRETTVLWDRETGKAIHKAIVWQDRRTSQTCRELREQGLEATFTEKTGLLLDPYFSGTKLKWLLDNVEGAREKARDGRLAFGTVDSWIVWKLTGGRVHATDATNASRTLLHDIRNGSWDSDLLSILDVPEAVLPEVKDCADDYGLTDPAILGAAVPILGVAGDQQAAALGQACFNPGMIKSTYGTGCFALLNTGESFVPSTNRLLTTVACRLDGRTSYALEGSIFIAGAAVQWLRDGLGIIERAEQTGIMADEADPGQQIYMVPAFTGLGAPHWDADARGAIFGLTRGTGPRELARAALESVAYQTLDLVEAMHADWQGALRDAAPKSGPKSSMTDTVIRVDGGMVASDWTMQRLSDILASPVDRPVIQETTALGAAWLAGSRAGVWPDRAGFADLWRLDRRFQPSMDADNRAKLIDGWRDAVRRTLS